MSADDHARAGAGLPGGRLAGAGLAGAGLPGAGRYLEDLRADVRAGLTATPKTLPPKYFYDARGSDLFDQITRLPEYYPTRAETAILLRHAADIAALSRCESL